LRSAAIFKELLPDRQDSVLYDFDRFVEGISYFSHFLTVEALRRVFVILDAFAMTVPLSGAISAFYSRPVLAV
jgi:hypothetical protein